MEITPEYEEHKQYTFEVYFKTVLINKARNLHNKRMERERIECSFSDLKGPLLKSVSYEDNYELEKPNIIVFRNRKIELFDILLKNAVMSLTPKYRTIVLLYYFEDYTDAMIAKQMNIPITTVQSRREKALSKLKEKMGYDYE